MLIFILILVVTAVWTALYILIIRPKLVAYRYTAGIYVALGKIEAGWGTRALLWARGLKVMIAGVLTSMIPLMGTIYAQLSGLDWTAFFSTEKAKIIAALIGIAGVVGPMLMAVLHSGALAEASAAEPVEAAPVPPIPPAVAPKV